MTNQIQIGTDHIWMENIDGSLNTDVLNDDKKYDEYHSVEIHGTVIDTQLCNDINTVIVRCGAIEAIRLSRCTINDMSEFMSVIARNSTVCGLSMEHCSDIDETNMMCIADKLSSNIHLTWLSLYHTRVTTSGFNHIMKSLITNTTMKELNITCLDLYSHATTDIIIRDIPMIKSLRLLATHGCLPLPAYDLQCALEKNYSLESLYLYNQSSTFDYIKFSERNKYIRTKALRKLLDLVMLIVPLIRVYKWLDEYCMMWIYEYVDVWGIHVNEFKKIRVIKSVFEFYKKKIIGESLRVVLPYT